MNENLRVEKTKDSSLLTHNSSPIKVLLVEDNPGDVCLIGEALAEAKGISFDLEYADRLQAGLMRLTKGGINVVLLDLSLPDSRGFDTLIKVRAQASHVPIVVLTGLESETLGFEAVKKGAQDYLIKAHVNSTMLSRVLRYAIERHRLQAELSAMSLVDDLTGLYNRRGFLTLTEHHLKLAHRTNTELLLIFADLDGLKQINDTLGHQEGDIALIEAANILKETFRESDIIARLGGDEFTVLIIEISEVNYDILTTRLRENLEVYNASGNRLYKLSISIGIALYDPKRPCSIDELLARADKLMYKQKQGRQRC